MQNKFETAIKIRDLIMKILNAEQGVFINVSHTDEVLNSFIALVILPELKDKVKIFFCEHSDTLIQKSINTLKAKMIEGEEFHQVEPFEKSKAEFISNLCMQGGTPAMLPPLCASIVCGISVIGVDVSEKKVEKLDSVVLSQSTTELEKNSAFKVRENHNDVMTKNIQDNIKNGEKYIFLGGLMHSRVAKKLGIQKISLFDSRHYSDLKEKFAKDTLFKELMIGKEGEGEPEYAYTYNRQDEVTVFQQLKLPLFAPETQIKTSSAFSEKTDGLFSGIFAKTAPSSSNVEAIKNALKTKYKLKDTSMPELASGLRTAANNNQFADIKKFIECGVDINARSISNNKTPLDYAVEKKHVKSIEVLLELGAKSTETVLELVKKDIEFFKTNDNFKKIREISAEKFPNECRAFDCTII